MYAIPFISNVFDAIRPSPHVFDDPADRLNYCITGVILLFCAMLVGAKQNIGSPIQCWVPTEFRAGWEQYIEDYCFIENTQYVPLHEELGHRGQDERERQGAVMVSYYQWVPFVFIAQAFMFYMPYFVWKTLCWYSGLYVETILRLASEADVIQEPKDRRSAVTSLARYIEDCMKVQKERERRSWFINRGLCGFVSRLYIFIKVLYMANIGLQFYLMEHFLGFGFVSFGFEILHNVSDGLDWRSTGRFPRVTLCEVDIRVLGAVHQRTFQCVLMIQMFNEKIYAFLWFWLVIVWLATLISLAYWMYHSCIPGQRIESIRRYMSITTVWRPNAPQPKPQELWSFVRNGVHCDGVLLVNFVASRCNDLLAAALTTQLYNDFCSGRFGVQVDDHPVQNGYAMRDLSVSMDYRPTGNFPDAVPRDPGFQESHFDPAAICARNRKTSVCVSEVEHGFGGNSGGHLLPTAPRTSAGADSEGGRYEGEDNHSDGRSGTATGYPGPPHPVL